MASKYWIGASSTSWNLSANWSLTSGGAGSAGVPTSSDDVNFDLNSNTRSCAITSIGMVCKSITITSGFTQTFTLNNTLTVSGDVNYGTGSWTLAGTTAVTVNASSTITTNGRTITHGLIFTGTITVTMVDNWTMSAGISISVTSSAITFIGSSAYTISCTTFSYATAGTTHTIIGNITCSGLISASPSTGSATVINGAFTITGSAGYTHVTAGTSQGTASFAITGGTLTWSSTGILRNNLTLSGTITLATANPIRYNGGVLTCTTGTITTTGSTLNIASSVTLNTPNITWNNITISGTATITLGANLTINGLLNLSGSTTFAGAFNISATSLTSTASGLTHKFVSGQTCTVTTALTLTGTAASNITVSSVTGGSQCFIILNYGASQDVGFVTVTDVNSNGGQIIWDYASTLSNTYNWNDLNTILTTINVNY